MAVRLRINERCDRCGEVQAQEQDGAIVFDIHRCPKSPPGPRHGPLFYRKSDVVFIPIDKS
jgi:hypothetical protein